MVYQPIRTPVEDATERETSQRRVMVVVDLTVIVATVAAVLASGIGASAPLRLDTPAHRGGCGAAPVAHDVVGDAVASDDCSGQRSRGYRRVLVASLWTACLVAAGAYAAGTSRARETLLVIMLLGTVLLIVGRNLLRILLHRQLARGGPCTRSSSWRPPRKRRPWTNNSPERAECSRAWACGPSLTAPTHTPMTWWPPRSKPRPTPCCTPRQPCRRDLAGRLGWAMEDTSLSLLVSPALADVAGPRLSIEPVEGLALVRVDMPRFSGPARVVKRTVDLVGSSVGLVLLAIPIAIIAVLIKRSSPGPVFFRQRRAGAGGTTFMC